MHFTESAPLPESLMNSLYTMARRDKQDRFRTQLNFVHHVGLLDYMQKIVPVTAFLVSNDKWPGPGEENEILPDIAANANVVDQVASNINALESEREILLNHIFILQGGPWSCSDLRNMDGQVVEASNGKNRVIVYDEEQDAPCLAVQMQGGDAPPEILACVVECNILARNGIMHVIDRAIFHVEDPPTATPSGPQPTESPQPSSGPPTVSPAPTSPSTAPSIDASPGNATEPDGSDNSRAPSTSPAPSISAQPTITAAPSISAQPTITATPTTTPTPTITAKPTASLSPNLDQATDGDSTISPAPTTTAQPTTTAAPTFTAAPIVTTSPSLAAPSRADGMELVFVTMTFNGIRIPVKGVPKLDEEGHKFFQTVTKDWYEMVYDEQVSSRPAGRRVTAATQQQQPPRRRNLQEAGIYNFTTHVNYTDQAVSHPWNTITYNQVVSYYRPKERQQLVTEKEDPVMESTEQDSSWPPTPRDVLLSPFYDDLLVKNYTDRLRQNELFANITDSGNPFAPRSSADDDTDQSNSSIGGGGSRNYWNVYFILAYIGFGLAVASTFFLTVDLLLKLLLRPSLPPREEDEAARRPPSEAPLIRPSGTRIEFDKRPSDDRSLN
jgi:Fasciclin domain